MTPIKTIVPPSSCRAEVLPASRRRLSGLLAALLGALAPAAAADEAPVEEGPPPAFEVGLRGGLGSLEAVGDHPFYHGPCNGCAGSPRGGFDPGVAVGGQVGVRVHPLVSVEAQYSFAHLWSFGDGSSTTNSAGLAARLFPGADRAPSLATAGAWLEPWIELGLGWARATSVAGPTAEPWLTRTFDAMALRAAVGLDVARAAWARRLTVAVGVLAGVDVALAFSCTRGDRAPACPDPGGHPIDTTISPFVAVEVRTGIPLPARWFGASTPAPSTDARSGDGQ